jgi:hypothetical protein
VNGVVLSDNKDMIHWNLEKSGKFTTKSLYRFIMNSLVRDFRMLHMWSANCPLKQNNFLWLCLRGQIQYAMQLVLSEICQVQNVVNI